MAEGLKIEIVSPERLLVSQTVQSVSVPGTEGYFADLRVTPKETAAGSGGGRTIYFDRAHGELAPPPKMAALEEKLHYALQHGTKPITPEALQGSRLLYLRAPNRAFADSEKESIVSFVRSGGSLLLVLDEEQRQKLAVVGANDFLAPFGMRLTGDTPRIPNTGAIAKAGEIHRADRQIPYDGGREVVGGTPFAYQLDAEGKPAQPCAAYAKIDGGGRVVVMGEGMASLFLGTAEGKRLVLDEAKPQWWGKDSEVFMEEVLGWLLQR